jgi:predicted transcriptional regulator
MARQKVRRVKQGKPRASISFSPDQYAEIERIAAAKKVSVAWVVREAIDRYIAEQWPLLPKT